MIHECSTLLETRSRKEAAVLLIFRIITALGRIKPLVQVLYQDQLHHLLNATK